MDLGERKWRISCLKVLADVPSGERRAGQGKILRRFAPQDDREKGISSARGLVA